MLVIGAGSGQLSTSSDTASFTAVAATPAVSRQLSVAGVPVDVTCEATLVSWNLWPPESDVRASGGACGSC